MTKNLPSALDRKEEILKTIGDKKLAVFLDYDGTLTPIVSRPDLAILSDDMRHVITKLARQTTVAVISGRKREEVESMMNIPAMVYAGSHGFDIKGPSLSMTPSEVRPLVPLIDKAYEQMKEFCRDISGSLVEHKKFAIAVHYRLVDPQQVPAMEKRIDQIVEAEPRLRKTGGKKIFEIRANIPWDKGRALLYLLKALGLEEEEACPVYLGDDETDEDAFAVLKNRGFGILVSKKPQNSMAQYSLKDTEEVKRFLKFLSDISMKGRKS